MIKYKARTVANDLQKKAKVILKGWTQCSEEEEDDVIAFCWRLRQARIGVYLYWGDTHEGIRVTLQTPRGSNDREWREVSGAIIDPVVDCIGTFATLAINEKRK